MALHDRSVRLTYDDYLLFPEDGLRHEIIDGEHWVSAAPFLKHQDVLLALATLLRAFVKERGLGRVYVAPVDVLLSRHDVVQPDLVFVSRERAAILTERNIQGAPDLVAEILSDGTRKVDEEVKLELFERFGIREYWLVDPRRERVRVYRLRQEAFELTGELTARETLTTPLLPGMTVPLADVFR
ncbi:MAG TPA: Uma2 family endonuclease [Thermoanaerobaculia bacterium]|nr:Uma2 family endonuclease [Thermoanaerobaculia bacterium]